jgi:uncharacterized integral membrane protein (TIGR00697 family)
MQPRTYKYYDFVMAFFVVVLLCSNLIGPGKLSYLEVFGFKIRVESGNLFFAFSYIFGDILTEVYGYARSRRVIWAGFGACFFSAIMAFVVVNIPSTMQDEYQRSLQSSLEVVFGNTWRIVLASLIAFWCGEFINSFVLAKMKILTKGKMLWSRTIGSTLFAQLFDSFIFYTIAFYGIWETGDLVKLTFSALFLKISWEVVLTPFTYFVVNKLKKVENEDYYDVNTDFNPFKISTNT